MLYPEFEKFKKLAEKHTRVIVYREIAGDLITPISLLKNFADRKYLFLLESANLDKSYSRYTFFGFNPAKVIKFKGKKLIVEHPGKRIEEIRGNPIEYMADQLKDVTSSKESELGDFCGGFVGFMGYDMVNYMNILRQNISEDEEDLIMAFLQTDEFYVFDNIMRKLYAAVSLETKGDPHDMYKNAKSRTSQMAQEIIGTYREFLKSEEQFELEEEFDMSSFMETVEALRREIIGGECIQVVLSNRYEMKTSVNPLNLYRLMRNINPSPYMFYIKMDEEVLCGTSPEIHLKISDRIAVLKPIAGTYRIDKDNMEEVKEKLLKDEKELAEHLMLLDLARNDLYTGCDTETVRVVKSFSPEVYSHVIHIVSEVHGTMRDDISPMRLFCNTFPAGTLSGAPKVRAMELIDQYERSPRGFYGGCAGYFSYSQDVDTCIIIRSAYVKKDAVTVRAGAGIVYDSRPEKEYREVGIKLGALFDALKHIRVLEMRNVFNDR